MTTEKEPMLRVLVVEDSEDDAQIVLRELKRGGYRLSYERVETAEALRSALARQPWDVVFADYTMPHFSGTQALEVVREQRLDVPFIFVSGTISEDTAVEAMKAGAQDYISKVSLKRLLPAVQRELREAERRREHAQAEAEALRQSRSFLEQAQEVGGIGSWVSSLRGDKRLWWSRETYRIFGVSEDAAISNDTFFQSAHPDDLEAIGAAVQRAIATHAPYSMDHRIRLPDGRERWVFERADVIYDAAGQAVDLIGVVQDITERKQAQATIERLAYFDTLTGLPNRTSLFARLHAAVLAAQASGQTLALLLININDFRDINDTLGHHNGDRFLIQVAERLRRALFDSDTIARLAGDEFVVLLPRLAQAEHIDLVVRKVVEALKPVLFIGDVPLEARTTIGIALYPEHGQDADTLYQHADVALSEAKTRHQAYAIYNASFDRFDPQRLALMAELRAAIASNALRLHFQPKVNLATRKVVGVEALVRWPHERRGLIAPDEFIPAAEKTGLIDELTEWVLHAALAQANEWHRAGIELEVSVNISARNLHDSFLISPVKGLLEQTGFTPGRLTLEITESAVMVDPDMAVREFQGLRKLGVQFAIDDFGTGYCSLGYLRRLPVNDLKIDKSFVINMHEPENATIVRSTVELAHNLGLRVTAEGVENEATLTTLTQLGCDVAQGYYISRPLPAEELPRWLRGR